MRTSSSLGSCMKRSVNILCWTVYLCCISTLRGPFNNASFFIFKWPLDAAWHSALNLGAVVAAIDNPSSWGNNASITLISLSKLWYNLHRSNSLIPLNLIVSKTLRSIFNWPCFAEIRGIDILIPCQKWGELNSWQKYWLTLLMFPRSLGLRNWAIWDMTTSGKDLFHVKNINCSLLVTIIIIIIILLSWKWNR